MQLVRSSAGSCNGSKWGRGVPVRGILMFVPIDITVRPCLPQPKHPKLMVSKPCMMLLPLPPP